MTTAVSEILKQAEPLSTDEQLILAAMLIEQARKKAAPSERYKWLDVMGAAPYPLVGEDAQAWITRTRQEGDDERERQWRRE